MTNSSYDLVIIGGGINGVAIALEASGRGLKTRLCDKGDLASATSSASTKLIHGGLRYLVNYEFGLVKESLQDRTNLAHCAPHLVKTLSFYIPFKQKNQVYWKTNIGLWLYHNVAKLPVLTKNKLFTFPTHAFLNKQFSHFLTFQDCYTDDARLVIGNAKKAQELGANISTYTELIAVSEQDNHWILTLQNQWNLTKKEIIKTKSVINATGPWVDYTHTTLFNFQSQFSLKLIQGSHILVPKLYEGHQAYLLPTTDNRIIFIIPYLDQFSMIGTTEVDISDNIKNNFKVNATLNLNLNLTQSEIHYLLTEINFYLLKKITQTDIIGHWSGARALPIKLNEQPDSPSKISRKVQLEWAEKHPNGPYLLSIWGGKLTTHRSLAVKALTLFDNKFSLKNNSIIYTQYLNCSNNPARDLTNILSSYPFISDQTKKRLIFSYGQDCLLFLSPCHTINDLGIHFGQGLYEVEINYLIHHEWAMTLDDILYRRTKMGWLLNKAEKDSLQTWLEKRHRV